MHKLKHSNTRTSTLTTYKLVSLLVHNIILQSAHLHGALRHMFLSHGMQGHLFILSILTRGSECDLAMDNIEFIAFYIITALLLVDYK